MQLPDTERHRADGTGSTGAGNTGSGCSPGNSLSSTADSAATGGQAYYHQGAGNRDFQGYVSIR